MLIITSLIFLSSYVIFGHYWSLLVFLGLSWSLLVILCHSWSFLLILGHSQSFLVVLGSSLSFCDILCCVLGCSLSFIVVLVCHQSWDYCSHLAFLNQIWRVIPWWRRSSSIAIPPKDDDLPSANLDKECGTITDGRNGTELRSKY